MPSLRTARQNLSRNFFIIQKQHLRLLTTLAVRRVNKHLLRIQTCLRTVADHDDKLGILHTSPHMRVILLRRLLLAEAPLLNLNHLHTDTVPVRVGLTEVGGPGLVRRRWRLSLTLGNIRSVRPPVGSEKNETRNSQQ